MRSFTAILVALLFSQVSVLAQSVGIGTTSPASNAILDVRSTSKGVLLPRLTTSQRNAIANPEFGLMVFDTDKGSLYLYDGVKWQRVNFAEPGSSPLFDKESSNGLAGDKFGNSVDINGDYAIVGAYEDDINGKIDQGSAYVFHRVNNVWVEETQLTGVDGLSDDFFGSSVGIYGDYIVVGAPGDDIGSNTDQGSVYVFNRQGNNWIQTNKFSDPGGGALDGYGSSVDISIDRFVVGAPNDNIGSITDQGSAHVYLLTGTIWAFETSLTSVDPTVNSLFGGDVAISFSTVLVGATGAASGGGNFKGAAYLFAKIITSWSYLTKLVSTQPSIYRFGGSVSLDGTTAVVGEWANSVFPPIIIQGRVNIYNRTNVTSWPLQAIIENPVSTNLHLFGESIQVSGDVLVVGSLKFTNNEDTYGLDSANVSVFKRAGTTWNFQSNYFTESPAAAFGIAVSLSGFNAVFGAPLKKASKGQVYFVNLE